MLLSLSCELPKYSGHESNVIVVKKYVASMRNFKNRLDIPLNSVVYEAEVMLTTLEIVIWLIGQVDNSSPK